MFQLNPTREETLNKVAAANGGDRLSKLPNDLLLNILERVDTLDAIRACVLSRQMLKLPAMLSQLFLSAGSIPGRHDKARVFSLREFLQINRAVAHVTDNILSTRCPDITITKLKIRFVLTQHDSLTICRSVARTMSTKKVAVAEFQITIKKSRKICSSTNFLQFGKQSNDLIGACPDAYVGLRCKT